MATSVSKTGAAPRAAKAVKATTPVTAPAKTSTKTKKSTIDKTRIEAPGMTPGLGQTQVLGSSTFRTPHSNAQASRARCVQCGKEVRAIPFALNNMVCRNCDGADRGRRVAALLLPDKSAEVLVADVTTDAVPDDNTSA